MSLLDAAPAAPKPPLSISCPETKHFVLPSSELLPTVGSMRLTGVGGGGSRWEMGARRSWPQSFHPRAKRLVRARHRISPPRAGQARGFVLPGRFLGRLHVFRFPPRELVVW